MPDTAQVHESREYNVAGMTCSHCAASVREEVAELSAVRTTDVDVTTARLTVTGTGLDDDAIRAAVAKAGYAVV